MARNRYNAEEIIHKLRRLWLNDGSCIRVRPERANHVWSRDFVFDRTEDRRLIRLMVVIDEYTRQCLAIYAARRVRAKNTIDVFADLMTVHRIPDHIRSDNGPEMIAKKLRKLTLKFDQFLRAGQSDGQSWANHALPGCRGDACDVNLSESVRPCATFC